MIMSNTSNSNSSFIKNDLSSLSKISQSSRKIEDSKQVIHFFEVILQIHLVYFLLSLFNNYISFLTEKLRAKRSIP